MAFNKATSVPGLKTKPCFAYLIKFCLTTSRTIKLVPFLAAFFKNVAATG